MYHTRFRVDLPVDLKTLNNEEYGIRGIHLGVASWGSSNLSLCWDCGEAM